MAEEQVRCANCGFLSGKQAGDAEYYAVSLQWRTTGTPDGPSGLGYRPHCFKGVCALGDEYEAQTGPGEQQQRAFLAVINRSRSCAEFYRHEHGRTPREHAEMKREELLQLEYRRQRESDRRFQDDRRERDLAEAAAQRERDLERAEQIRQQDKEEAERIRREDREWRAEQDRKLWVRSILSGVLVAIIGVSLAATFAILTEPWKQQDRRPTPPKEPPSTPATTP
jgi:hypothetical protein